MAITYPVPSGSQLPTRNAARQLVAEQELAFVAARYRVKPGQRERSAELIYMRTAETPGGFFLPPYDALSTRDGHTYTIVREGGWPKDLELHAQEDATPSTTAWTTLATIDLTQESTRTLSGAFNPIHTTIAGYTVDLIKTGNNDQVSIVNGLGVRAPCDSGLPGVASGISYGGAYIGVRSNEIPAFDNDKQTCVQARFANVSGRGLPNWTGFCAFAVADGGDPFDSNALRRNVAVCGPLEYSTNYGSWYSGGADYSNPINVYTGISYPRDQVSDNIYASDWVSAVVVRKNWLDKYGLIFFERGATDFCPVEAMSPIAGAARGVAGNGVLHLGGVIGLSDGSKGIFSDYYLTHLRILQKADT